MSVEDTLKEKLAQEDINRLAREKLETLKQEIDSLEVISNLNKIQLEQEEAALIKKIDLLRQAKELSTEEKQQLEGYNAELAKVRAMEENRKKVASNRIREAEKEQKRLQQVKELYFGLVKADEKRLGFGAKFKAQYDEIKNISKTISKEDARATLAAKLTESGTAMFAIAMQQAMAFNSLTVELNKATNTSGKYNDAISSVAMSNSRLGITAMDAQKATEALHNEFADFSNLSKEVETNLINTTAQLEKAGISANATAKFLDVASKSMGMGAEQTLKYEKELFAFAKANQISTKMINDGLSSVMPRLAAFGKQGPAIFKEMAFRSKALGIEMGKLLDVTEKFTTFEGAAEAAGNLNSVLGGNYLDSLQLLRAASEEPVKAQDMLRDALQKTGKSFDQLSGQQRRMFAEMLGTDMDTAASFFKKTSLEAKQAADAEKAFNDAVAAFVPIGDKLKAIIGKMAPVFQTLSSVIGTVVDIFTQLLDIPGVSYLVAFGGALLTLAGIATAVGTTFGGFVLTIAAQLLTISTAISGASASAGASAVAAGSAIAAGGAEAAAGGAGFVAAGTQTAAGSTMAAGGLIAFTTAVTPLIPALVPLAGVLWALAGAFLAVSLPIALILLGVIGIILAIGHLFKILIDGGTASLTAAIAFGILAVSLYGLAAALGTLGTLGSIGLGVLLALSAVMLVFGASFLMVGQGMQMAKEGFDAITNFEISKLENMRNIMSQMADYMERLSTAAVAFSVAMMNPLVMPVMAAAVAVQPASNLTNGVTTAASSQTTAANNKEQTISANLTIEVPVTMNGKQVDKLVYNKIVQFNQNPRVTEDSRVIGNNTVGSTIVPTTV